MRRIVFLGNSLSCLKAFPPEARSEAGFQLRQVQSGAAALIARIKTWNLTQLQASTRLGITRPRLNDLLRGKLSKFSLDALVGLTFAAGLVLEMNVKDAA